MPFADDKPTGLESDIHLPKEGPKVYADWQEIANAGMSKWNPITELYNRGFKPDFEVNEDYHVFDDIEGYEDYTDSFVGVNSADEAKWVKSNIDRYNTNEQILQDSGWGGVVSEVAGGLTNPVLLASMFVPGAGQTIWARIAVEASIAGGAEVVSETVLHQLQDARTSDETVTAIASAAVVAGVMGGVIAKLSKKEVSALEEGVALDMATEDVQPFSTSAGAMSSIRSVEDMTPQHWGKVLSKAAKVTSLGQVFTQPSAVARNFAMNLAETPYVLAMNKSGIASPVAVETAIKRWDGPLAESIGLQRKQYKAWKQSTSGTYDEFRAEIGRALRRGDTVGNQAVDAVARKYRQTLYDQVKLAAQKSKLLPEEMKLLNAGSYFPRVYNQQRIRANQNAFDQFLVDQFMAGNKSLDPIDALEAAVKTRDNILGLNQQVVPSQITAKASALKARKLDIPDDLLEPWLISDVEIVSRNHIRGMATEVEFALKFDGKNIDDIMRQVSEEYAVMITKADPKQAVKLGKQRDKTIEALRAMHGRLTGSVGNSPNPGHWAVRLGRSARQLNLLRLLGGMTLSAIPDMARPVLIDGLANYMGAMGKVVVNPAAYHKARGQVKRFGVGVDMILDGRLRAYSELQDSIFDGATKFEHGLEKLSTGFGKISLMSQWNASAKQMTGVMSMDNILSNVVKGSGKEQLAKLGINDDMAKRIHAQAEKHGDLTSTFNLANSGAWTDFEAAKTFETAVLKEVDTLIVTPGIGDKNIIFDSETGKTILQFKSFGFAAVNRMMLSGMNPRDLKVINFMLVSATLGAVASSIKLLTADRWEHRPKTAEGWAKEGIDRSGLLAIFTEPANMAAKFVGKESSRYASRSFSESLLGSSVGLLGNIAEVGTPLVQGLLGNQELKQKNLHHVRKLLPYNNLFYTRWALDNAEKGIGEALGAQ